MWFKNAVIYQLHVKSFYDLNSDGIGDFAGLSEKLDYLESLGITAMWLLPFYPSPLRDDGYDIANYQAVNPQYGTLRDFKNFLHEAHKRGLKVITELVINHTSDQHRWFQHARRAAKDSVWRDFYVWSDDPHRYKDARIIFKDFETSNWAWDPVAKSYYFHRFYSHQPDLNFENPLVQRQVFKIVNFWLEMGVDGLRLDAIPYLFKKEDTNCENLAETHDFIKKLRAFVDSRFTDRVLIAEANQWPEDAVAYFGESDECHMAFHFPVMPRLFMAIQMEDRLPLVDIMEQTPQLPDTCQWLMFLRNHDELTLEMVSDSERDYMYRIYAKDPKARLNLGIRRRLAPLLDNDRAKIELMNILLFSLPGTPVLYYGDEIGMGDNYYLGDRHGVRTPMQWNSNRSAGFSKANPQKLYLPLIIDPSYHYELVNVENQEQNPTSLLWWIRRALAVRKNYKAFGYGALEFVAVNNSKILAFTQTYEEEIILVIANLSRFSLAAELDLSKYAGHTPKELFYNNDFPTIKNEPYIVTCAPYGYFWLSLQPSKQRGALEAKLSKIEVAKRWENVFKGKAKQILEREILPKFLKKARWFEGKSANIEHIQIKTMVKIAKSMLCFLEVSYREREAFDTYLLPISFSTDTKTASDIITTLAVDSHEGILYDSIHDESFRKACLLLFTKTRKVDSSAFTAYTRQDLKKSLGEYAQNSRLFSADQSNSSLLYDNKLFLKLYRRLESGVHPEVELERYLTEQANFTHIPPFAGALEYKKAHTARSTIALLQEYVPNEGTVWKLTIDSLSKFFEEVLTLKETEQSPVTLLDDLIGGRYLEIAKSLGERSAELHIALIPTSDDSEFRPEPFTTLYQRSLYQDMRRMTKSVCELLKKERAYLAEDLQKLISLILDKEQEILTFFQKIRQKPLAALRTRIHGDYHLGQVLYTGKDFCIIDFEGEPLHTLERRRSKQSPLKDVAGMVRSFHYAAHKALSLQAAIQTDLAKLERWADSWCERVTGVFLKAYFQKIETSAMAIVPNDRDDCMYLLQAFALEKALYEVAYELNVRPEWMSISCKGILYTMKRGEL